jgi:hypothetical protein
MSQENFSQDDRPELKEHLAKNGIKMNDKKIRRKHDERVNQIGTTISVKGSTNANGRSSYDGIFGN